MTKKRGFTLLELLVVLALVVLLLSLAVSRIGAGNSGQSLRQASLAVMDAARQARGIALAQNRSVSLMIDVEAVSVQVADQAPISLDPALRLSTTTAIGTTGLTAIDFFPDGSSTGGRVRLGLDRAERVIRIDWLTGQAVVESGAQ